MHLYRTHLFFFDGVSTVETKLAIAWFGIAYEPSIQIPLHKNTVLMIAIINRNDTQAIDLFNKTRFETEP